MTVTTSDSKQLVERYLHAISGHRKPQELVAQFVTDAHLAAHIRDVEAAFPEYELIADDLVADGDRVAMRGSFRGFHRGPFAGIPATGRAVSAPLMIIYRVRDGRIAEHWLHFDGAALVAQLQQPTTHG